MADEYRRGPTLIEIRAVVDPTGRNGILIQLESGFAILKPRDALDVALMIVDAFDAIETRERLIDLADPPDPP